MNVSDLMTTAVKSCVIGDSLQRAAQLMWENDCGVVPVLDGEGRVVGMITDRDICMAAYTHGQALWATPGIGRHGQAGPRGHGEHPLDVVETLMRRVRVRRVPVLDGNGHLKGILSMNDLARHAHRSAGRKSNGLSGDSVVQTLASNLRAAPGRKGDRPRGQCGDGSALGPTWTS